MRRVLVLMVMLAGCGDPTAGPSECESGESRACYQGSRDTRGIGGCRDGLETCASGVWPGTCIGDVTPFVERCDGEDNDCDGEIDNAASTGEACASPDGCAGQKTCRDGAITCVAPDKNECGVCDGPSVSGLGSECSSGSCSGSLVCSDDGDAAVCSAPVQNACELCGGPPISGLGTACTGPNNCAGELVCNASGNNTTCSCNPVAGQCRDGGALRPVEAPVTGDLVITEVMPSPSAVSDTLGEWFEVQVLRDVDINQLQLDRAGDSSPPILIESASCLRVTAGTRLLFARSADPTLNGGLPAVTRTFSFSLISGTSVAPGDVRLLLDSTVLDAITWTSSTSGRSRQLDPDLTEPAANDNTANFCDGTTPYGTGTPQDLGSPAGGNVECALLPPAGSCTVGGAPRPIIKPAAGALVITELLANPAGSSDSVREWFEISNTSSAAFDLNDLIVGRASGSGGRVQSAACITVAAGAFALLARSNDPAQNGMLPPVDATFGTTLVDSGGDLEVRDGATVLDAVTWPSSTSGVARQLDPDLFTPAGNDMATSFCAATTPYGDNANLGTPRTANAQCP